MRIIKTPWKKDFIELVENSKKSIKLTSPFISENICSELIESKPKRVDLEIITSFKIASIYSGALNLNGISAILKAGGIVLNHQKLHSKIYIFDNKKAIITSGNLTNGGFIKNYEYGILVDEYEIVNRIVDDFAELIECDETGNLTTDKIAIANSILSEIPKQEKMKFPDLELDSYDKEDILKIKSKSIERNLNGWKLEVFRAISKIDSFSFHLRDLEGFESEFSEKYPTNNNIMAKVRQQLQYLRDLGLVEFLGKGKYRKLWK